MKEKVATKTHEVIRILEEQQDACVVKPEFETLRDSILHGDAGRVLQEIPDKYAQCIITSPPYYCQRDYQVDEQIGQEQTPERYITQLVQIFGECRRVLQNNGTLWLNLGDKYSDGRLLGLPWRVALALVADGWILRSDIIWQKPNAMPSSVKTRPTTDHEYIFMFSKGNDYYYDADAIREPHVTFSEGSKVNDPPLKGRACFGKSG